jgi:hypothetical protein
MKIIHTLLWVILVHIISLIVLTLLMVSCADMTLNIPKTLSRKNTHVLCKTLSKFCFTDTNSDVNVRDQTCS